MTWFFWHIVLPFLGGLVGGSLLYRLMNPRRK